MNDNINTRIILGKDDASMVVINPGQAEFYLTKTKEDAIIFDNQRLVFIYEIFV